jgi:gamma-glutamyltranspeptidase/glutathione hydrolase
MAFTTRPEIVGSFGVVAATHWTASQVGMAVLEKGGNAFDAAVAAGFVLHVVEPHMNGPGGDAVTLVRRAGETEPTVICGQGTAPARATIAHYKAEGLDLIPGNGLLAAVVPGAFDSWMVMLRDYGTITLAEALTPAIAYARDGWPVIAGATEAIQGAAAMFTTEWTSSAAVYMPDGKAPVPGELFRSPTLAATYARILKEASAAGADREQQIEAARRIFYKGWVAEEIERFATSFAAMDASGRRHKGVLTAADMAGWQATYERPVSHGYRGWTVAKAGPWAQSPALLQTLALLEGFDLAAMGVESPDFVHHVVEAMKLAYADREAWYGDPRFVDVPMAGLLADAYTAQRRALIGERASATLRPGNPDGRPMALPRYEIGSEVGEPGAQERQRDTGRDAYRAGGTFQEKVRATRGPAEGDTCHIDVIDRWGNVVAATPSGGWLQSSPVVPNLGFCLGTRAQMFWLQEGLPTSLKPGSRPRTTLTPTLAAGPDGEVLAFGSPGGDSQDQWIAQFFLRVVDGKRNLQEAIDTPQFQTDHHPNSFYPRKANPLKLLVEDRFGAATIDGLKKRGHEVEASGPWSLGRNCAALKRGPRLAAAATPRRGQAYAVGR